MTDLTKLFTEIDTKADASEVEDVKSRIEALEDANAKRTTTVRAETTEVETKAAKMDAANVVIKGIPFINSLNMKATEASITVDAEGAYAIPKIFAPDVTGYLRKGSVLRTLATVQNSGSKYTKLIKLNGSSATTRDEKTLMANRTNDTYAELTLGHIDVYDSQRYTAWAEEGDAVIDLAGEIVRSIGSNIGEKQAEHFMLGTDTNALRGVVGVTTVPTGILNLVQEASADRFTNAVGKLGVVSADVAGNSEDDLFGIFADFFAALHSRYKAGSSYGVIIGSDMELLLRKSRDANKNFMWAGPSGVAGAQPGTIWGVPYYVDDFMPSIADAAGKPVALVGDFSNYVINDYSSVKLLRDEVTAPGFIQYHSRQRVGGCLMDFQSVRGLVLNVTP